MKNHRLGRHGHAGFGGVVGIVKPDADELARAADASADAGSLRHYG